jgi:yeast amino acid transporter
MECHDTSVSLSTEIVLTGILPSVSVYAFLGTELVGVTVGETQNPRKAMPKAIRLTFFRILFFYVLSVFFLGMVVPFNSRELIFASKSKTSAAASPFVVAVQLAGINGLDHFINVCLLIFVFSASNSGKITLMQKSTDSHSFLFC